jgi:hypothetical protein
MKELLRSQVMLLRLYGQELLQPGEYNKAIFDIREKLIEEEYTEFQLALEELAYFSKLAPMSKSDADVDEARAHLLKEFADLLVVLFGTMAQLGFTDTQLGHAFELVDIDNKSKAYVSENVAQEALEYWQTKDPGCAIQEVDIELGLSRNDRQNFKFYIINNSSGKVMKRFVQPEFNVEQRILQYCIQEQQDQKDYHHDDE